MATIQKELELTQSRTKMTQLSATSGPMAKYRGLI